MTQCLQRDPKERPTIEELLNHQYIKAESDVLEDQVSRKLLSFINFIQDYEYIVGVDDELDDAILYDFANLFLDTSKEEEDVDNLVQKIGEMLQVG